LNPAEVTKEVHHAVLGFFNFIKYKLVCAKCKTKKGQYAQHKDFMLGQIQNI